MVNVLRVLAALESKVSTQDIDRALMAASNDSELDKQFEEMGLDMTEYHEKWATLGVGTTYQKALAQLIQKHYSSIIEYALQSALELKGETIKNHSVILNTVYNEVANEIDKLPYKQSLRKVLSRVTRSKISYNLKRYESAFKKTSETPDMVITAPEQYIIEVTDKEQALRNVKGADIYAILHALHSTGPMYYYAPKDLPVVTYSIYQSFLREYFRLALPRINSKIGGGIEVILPTNADTKLKKLDELMGLAVTNFIIPGISKDNVSALSSVTMILVQAITITNTAAMFGVRGSGESTGGNVNSPYVFKSKQAARYFDNFISAFLALSKLHKYLKEADASVYNINYTLFQSGRVMPADKFYDLNQLVKYSNTFCEIRDKYNMSGFTSDLRAFGKRESQYFFRLPHTPLALQKSQDYNIFEDLYTAVNGIFKDDKYNKVIMLDPLVCFNIWDMVRAMDSGINPFYVVVPATSLEPALPDDLLDPDTIIDELYMAHYLTDIFGEVSGTVYDFDFSYDLINLHLRHAKGPYKEVMLDLVRRGISREVSLLMATYKVAEELELLRINFLDLYRFPEDFSRTEYASLFNNAEMFKEAIEVLDYKDAFSGRQQSKEATVKIATILIAKHYPEVTEAIVEEFLYQEPESTYYSSFITTKVLALYKQIVMNLAATKSHFINITNNGASIYLKSSELVPILADIDETSEVDMLEVVTKGTTNNEAGYIIDALGDPFSVIYRDNIVGALHSSGYYIFTDGSVTPWRAR